MEGGSIPGQSFKRASQRIGDETWPYKNGRFQQAYLRELGPREYVREQQQQWYRGGKGQVRLGTEWKQGYISLINCIW